MRQGILMLMVVLSCLVLASHAAAYDYIFLNDDSFESAYGGESMQKMPKGVARVGDVITFQLGSFFYLFTDADAFYRQFSQPISFMNSGMNGFPQK